MATDSHDLEPQDGDRSAETQRSGADTRRRGWFWHWNNVVTQYAPLIGLKGVGLLNSYTVWTDRRDESPHRGYAFPSQQSEADFYGEERAELITINKILVALDLIEIRKEMLTRVDERGRRWRVPHNLYRVKDRPDGVDLRAIDVLRVAELAKQDASVFRHVRRVFSERFKPIDGDNVWHSILTELRGDPTWRELQERTRVIEARASARTRAGHQSRASGARPQEPRDRSAPPDTDDPDDSVAGIGLLPHTQHNEDAGDVPATSVEATNTGSHPLAKTDVGTINTGSTPAVGESNTGSGPIAATSVAARSNGRQRFVGPSNTTYDQTDLTTTTTTTGLPDGAADHVAMAAAASTARRATAARRTDRTAATKGDPIGCDDPAIGASEAHRPRIDERNAGDPTDRRADARSIGHRVAVGEAPTGSVGVMLAAVNEGMDEQRGRGVVSGGTAMDERLDAQTEGDEHVQRATGARAGGDTRERSLADPAAGGPLVDPGPLVVSTFEAANDRRATPLERRLLAELERDADPAARAAGESGADWVVAAMREAVASGSTFVAPKRIREIIARWSTDPRRSPSPAPSLSPADSPEASAAPADVRLPGGASGDAAWSAVLGDLARALDHDAYQRLLAGSRVTRYWRGTVEVRVASVSAADKLSNEYRGLIERHLNSRLRRPVAVSFEAAQAPSAPEQQRLDATGHDAPDTSPRLTLTEAEVEVGRQVWQSLLADLVRVVAPVDLERLAGVVVLGQDAGGAILLGAPSPLARRLIDGRYRAAVESSLVALLGQRSPIRVIDVGDWSIGTRQ